MRIKKKKAITLTIVDVHHVPHIRLDGSGKSCQLKKERKKSPVKWSVH